ncbi:MAG: acetolactate decarboxylase [Planctomycetales bacterium]
MRFVRVLVVVVALAVGCTSSAVPEAESDSAGWDGTIRQWGTLRDVMHGEVMEGQVRLAEVTDESDVVGIGAPHRLQGEIVITDGAAWVAEVRQGNRIETRRSVPRDSAVFLAVARVPRWTEVKLERDVSADAFDEFIGSAIDRAGLGGMDTVPFLVEGVFPSLHLHVLNGQCPFAEIEVEQPGTGPPHRMTLNDARGLLVGFYSETGAGRITHHGSRTHAHALVGPEDGRVVGHVDAVTLKAGTIIRVPADRSPVD